LNGGAQNASRRRVAVLPDVSGIDRTFVYEVPDDLEGAVGIGTIVRIPLHGRRVRGWVVDEDREPGEREVLPIAGFVSIGPTREVVELCRFGAWRYAGRLRPFLVASSPERIVRGLPDIRPKTRRPNTTIDATIASAVGRAFANRSSVLRLPPAAPRFDVVVAAIEASKERGLLVLVPERADVELLSRRLSRIGVEAAAQPDGFAAAVLGREVVVGTRTSAFAPSPALGGVVVLDAHAEAYAEQRAPTWDATVIVQERARRAEIPCVLVSACPTLVELASAELVTVEPQVERHGWATFEMIDRRTDDPRSGLFSPALGEIVRSQRRADPDAFVVCVLNRTGRARLLACSQCKALTRCERCGAALKEHGGDVDPESALSCPVCGASRPFVCAVCGSTRLSRLRLGTARVAEELAALIGEPVAEVSAPSEESDREGVGVFVGTEAVLHRLRRAALVIFLDFDQELLAPRYRAGEQSLVLLSRASRLVGDRSEKGRVLVQTRLPDHEVLLAAKSGDPGLFVKSESARREALGLPPYRALAEVSGEEAAPFCERLLRDGLDVGEIEPGRFLVRAEDSSVLADALRRGGAPKEGVRVAVDPVRL